MPILSLSDAARSAGVARSTLYRKIHQGVVSTVKNHDGSRGVDTSEILRVFGGLQGETSHDTSQPAPPDTDRDVALLQAENALLRDHISLLKDELEASRRLLDTISQRLLPAPRKKKKKKK